MPKRGPSSEIRERVIDMTWSLWSDLGVSGWRPRHSDWAIDPEPLIVFTASLDDLDARLRDESLDWCIRYARYISKVRLKNLIESDTEKVRASFGPYAATVNRHAGLLWPHATRARRYEPTGKSGVEDFTSPALIALRLRSLFGVSARTEIIRAFLSEGPTLSAAELSDLTDYKKRNVAEALDSLRLGGLLHAQQTGNQIRYRLNRHEIRSVLTPLPKIFPFWKPIFRVLNALLNVDAREGSLSKAAQAVEARRVVDRISHGLDDADLRGPNTSIKGQEFWDGFIDWASEITGGLAFAEPERVFREDAIPAR